MTTKRKTVLTAAVVAILPFAAKAQLPLAPFGTFSLEGIVSGPTGFTTYAFQVNDCYGIPNRPAGGTGQYAIRYPTVLRLP
jgi:hypothetical protein